jgi:uncharacterized circularly permuted ATP-grasp superfamily protein/uncharacterized alpha-E superfamily protein
VSPPERPSLLDDYRAPDGTYDELLTPGGAVRPHWRAVARALDALGGEELERRRRESQRLLRDDGVTYTVYETSGSTTTPWRLDPVPLVLAADEWARLERGVAQRAHLLDLVLRDVYGERALVRTGAVPPEVVYGHGGYLRAAADTTLPARAAGDDRELITYAADVGRDPAGDPHVIADYAQAPSGAGFALANRLVLSRVLPGLYRESGVQRLAPFFRTLRATLAGVAPAGVEDPTVVVLTPGPRTETYFEHAHLARHLGYPLVEGRDLVVQEGRVWLRSVGGPAAVDVVLRRVDGWSADPLELQPTSRLGVPGLVEAARRGRVAVVNGFGASVLENPGLVPFLPAAARLLLSEELELPSPETWWCGDPVARAHVLAHLDDLVIKPLTPRPDRAVIAAGELARDQREELVRRIEARPWAWVGQQRLPFSSLPCVVGPTLAPRPVALRCFAVAGPDGYQVLPGGLARVASAAHHPQLSAQRGGSSKDTWVVTPEPEPAGGFWLRSGPGVTALGAAEVLSPRAAENLFWLGRYAERSEAVVRLVRTALDRHGEFAAGASPAGTACLTALLEATTHLTDGYPGFVGDGAAERLVDPTDELRAVLAHEDRPGSLASSLRRMVEAADAVRDQLSSDTWLAVSTMGQALTELAAEPAGADARAGGVVEGGGRAAGWPRALATVLRDLLTLAGLMSESMVRDPGWHFFDAGRRIERGIQLARLLDATVIPTRSAAADSLLLESLLVTTESIITYRRRYRSRAQLQTVLDVLLLDATNPRSLRYQLDRLGQDLANVRRNATGDGEAPERRAERAAGDPDRAVAELLRRLEGLDTAALAGRLDSRGRHRAALSHVLLTMADRLAATSDALDERHFDRREPERTLLADQPAWFGDVLSASAS